MFENIQKYSKNLASFYFNVLLIWGGWGGLLAAENTEFLTRGKVALLYGCALCREAPQGLSFRRRLR